MIIQALLLAVISLFHLFFLVVGLSALGTWGSFLWKRWTAWLAALQSRDWIETTGRITRSVVTFTSTHRNRYYAPAIRYTYNVSDMPYVSGRLSFQDVSASGEEGESKARAVVERFGEGNTVRVYYDPKRPRRATLDRDVPPVIGFTLIWSLLLLPAGCGMVAFCVSSVIDLFLNPPILDELPPMRAQLGWLLGGLGALFLLISAVRAVGQQERRQRQLLRCLKAAKPTLINNARHGEHVIVFGHAEELTLNDEEDDEEDTDMSGEDAVADTDAGDIENENENEDEDTDTDTDTDTEDDDAEHISSFQLPFADEPLLYYYAAFGPGGRADFTPFSIRDETGVAWIYVGAGDTSLRSREIPIQDEVERWVDEQCLEYRDVIPADMAKMSIQSIRQGDLVLVMGHAEREDEDSLLLFSREGMPLSLIADAPREEIIERLSKGSRRTRTFLLFGCTLLIAGAMTLQGII